MDHYVQGNGHSDLANQLGMAKSVALALPGSCNGRIIRTTLKDSYMTKQPTLYVIGLSFLHRNEMPVSRIDDFEGRWLSFQNELDPEKIDGYFWSLSDSKRAVECFSKLAPYALNDQLEQLMFSLLAMVSDLINRGHQVVIFRQASEAYANLKVLDEERFKFLKDSVNIVDGLKWSSLEFLAEKNIMYNSEDSHLLKTIQHPAPGEHLHLNKFLVEYITTHKLL
jgi:hypothetical protein